VSECPEMSPATRLGHKRETWAFPKRLVAAEERRQCHAVALERITVLIALILTVHVVVRQRPLSNAAVALRSGRLMMTYVRLQLAVVTSWLPWSR
jgi:hypothetical protein